MRKEWTLILSKLAIRELDKLDIPVRRRIVDFLEMRLLPHPNPKALGKRLIGKNLWRYRVGNYRIICDIQKHEMTILTLTVGHRSDVYSEKF